LLSFIQEHIPADRFLNVVRAVPGANSLMIDADEEAEEASAGTVSSGSGLAGKLFGSAGGPAALVGKLTLLGFSADQLERFVPTALDFLKSKLPSDIMNKITALIPLGGKVAN
jgi:hypothetical protein